MEETTPYSMAFYGFAEIAMQNLGDQINEVTVVRRKDLQAAQSRGCSRHT